MHGSLSLKGKIQFDFTHLLYTIICIHIIRWIFRNFDETFWPRKKANELHRLHPLVHSILDFTKKISHNPNPRRSSFGTPPHFLSRSSLQVPDQPATRPRAGLLLVTPNLLPIASIRRAPRARRETWRTRGSAERVNKPGEP